MKFTFSASQAAVFLEVLRKIEAAQAKSPTIMAALDIDRHDLAKCRRMLNELEKTKK